MKISRAAKHLAVWVTLPSFIATSRAAPGACSPAQAEAKIAYFNQAVTRFMNICADEKGKVARARVVTDDSGAAVSCADQYKKLMALSEEVHSQIQAVPCTPVGATCPSLNPANLLGDSGKPICTAEETEANSPSRCARDISKSIAHVAGGMVDGESSCVLEFIHAVIQDVAFNVEGLWKLITSATKPKSEPAPKSGPLPPLENGAALGFQKLEDKTSDASLHAGHTPNALLDQMKADPAGFAQDTATAIVLLIDKSVKENFGCESWDSGLPHVGNCTKPMSNWDCASCHQRINAACGLIGYMGGEIATAYVVGGVAGASRLLLRPSMEAAAVVSARIAESAPTLARRGQKVVDVGVAASSKYQDGIKSVTATWDALMQKPAMKSFFSSVDEVKGTKFGGAAQQALRIGVLGVAKVSYPVREYVSWMEKGFSCGLKQASKTSDEILDHAAEWSKPKPAAGAPHEAP